MTPTNDHELEQVASSPLEQIANDIEVSLTSRDAEARTAALERVAENRPLLERLFPGQTTKALDAVTADEIQAVGAHKVAMLELHASARYRIAEQEANTVLKANGMYLSSELGIYAADRLEVMGRELDEYKVQCADRLMGEAARLERYRGVPKVYDAMAESFDMSLKSYFAVFEELLEQFRTALTTKFRLIEGSRS